MKAKNNTQNFCGNKQNRYCATFAVLDYKIKPFPGRLDVDAKHELKKWWVRAVLYFLIEIVTEGRWFASTLFVEWLYLKELHKKTTTSGEAKTKK